MCNCPSMDMPCSNSAGYGSVVQVRSHEVVPRPPRSRLKVQETKNSMRRRNLTWMGAL